METLLTIGVANVLVAAALAVLAWTAGRVCRRPALAHGLWVLVFLKLLAPPLFELRVPGPSRPAASPAPRRDLVQQVPKSAPPLNLVVTVPVRVEPSPPLPGRLLVAQVLADPAGMPQIVFTEPVPPAEPLPVPAGAGLAAVADPPGSPADGSSPVADAPGSPPAVNWLALRLSACTALSDCSVVPLWPPRAFRSRRGSWPVSSGCRAVPTCGWCPGRCRRWSGRSGRCGCCSRRG
jgi:hypothetical protein